MATLSQDSREAQKILYRLVAKAWLDETFKQRFVSETATVLEENGLTIPNGLQIKVNQNASAEIARIKAQGDRDMYVFGSADLSKTFINDDLVDEYRIGIAPVILGSGRPLFKQGTSSRNLSLVSTQQLSTGGVVLKFTKAS